MGKVLRRLRNMADKGPIPGTTDGLDRDDFRFSSSPERGLGQSKAGRNYRAKRAALEHVFHGPENEPTIALVDFIRGFQGDTRREPLVFQTHSKCPG
jgi:hypothetical protein